MSDEWGGKGKGKVRTQNAKRDIVVFRSAKGRFLWVDLSQL